MILIEIIQFMCYIITYEFIYWSMVQFLCQQCQNEELFYLITNQAIRKNVMSCRHEFEVAGIFAMAILNFFLVLIYLNYALIFVINQKAGKVAKSKMKCFQGRCCTCTLLFELILIYPIPDYIQGHYQVACGNNLNNIMFPEALK